MPIEKESALEKELRDFNERIQVVDENQVEEWVHHYFRALKACAQSECQVERSFSYSNQIMTQPRPNLQGHQKKKNKNKKKN